jgi:hypothetical protein
MLYYSTGGIHAPHNVFKQWADKYQGQFDEGWDIYRRKTFERQKELWIVRPDAELTERPDLFPAWDSLSETQQKLYARQMGRGSRRDRQHAGLLHPGRQRRQHAGHGHRLVQRDDVSQLLLDADRQLELIEQYGRVFALGDEHTAPHFALAWAHANNTPFQWGKQMAGHPGGARDPMVVAWPTRIRPDSAVRSQFTHCIDIAPTVLDAIGLPEPTSVDRIDREPMDGTSFLLIFDDPAAEERHTVQYFEMFGSRAVYKDVGVRSTGQGAVGLLTGDATTVRAREVRPAQRRRGAVYYLPDDFSRARNLAAEHPDKVAELTRLWWQEAERNRVLPLLGGLAVMFGSLPPLPTTTRFTFKGDVRNIQRGMVSRIFGRSYAIEARLAISDSGGHGVIVANADFIGGFALWVDEGRRLHHTYSFLGVETYRQVSTQQIPTGDVTVRMLFDSDQPVAGSGGRVTLWANDRLIGEGAMAKTVPLAFTSYAGMDISRDNGPVVDRDYEDKAPYAFAGTVKEVIFDLKPVHEEAEKALHEHASVQAVGQGAAG